jgi:hypothetical protein
MARWLSRRFQWWQSLLPSTYAGCAEINARERPWALKRRRVNCKPVLHRPVEPAHVIGKFDGSGVLRSTGTWSESGAGEQGAVCRLSGSYRWHLKSACRMRHLRTVSSPNRTGNLCKRLRFIGGRLRTCEHNARRLLRISDNDSDGLIYGLP